MSRFIDIDNEKFWDILFDEACVEGSQAERIENELNKISVDSKEIRAKAIDEFVSTLVPRLTDAIYPKDVESMTNLITSVAEELKAGEENV